MRKSKRKHKKTKKVALSEQNNTLKEVCLSVVLAKTLDILWDKKTVLWDCVCYLLRLITSDY